MKTCMISGDMFSDRTSEQYPSVTVCDACVTGLNAPPEGEESPIINVTGQYDSIHGDNCHFCEKSKSEEDVERGYPKPNENDDNE